MFPRVSTLVCDFSWLKLIKLIFHENSVGSLLQVTSHLVYPTTTSFLSIFIVRKSVGNGTPFLHFLTHKTPDWYRGFNVSIRDPFSTWLTGLHSMKEGKVAKDKTQELYDPPGLNWCQSTSGSLKSSGHRFTFRTHHGGGTPLRVLEVSRQTCQ